MEVGRKAFKPTDKQRSEVKLLAGYGIPQDEIAQHIGIDPKTLRKYFSEELAAGALQADIAVIRNLHRLASKSDNPAAGIFWAKTRRGWREKDPLVDENRTISININRGPDRKANEPELAEVKDLDEKRSGTA